MKISEGFAVCRTLLNRKIYTECIIQDLKMSLWNDRLIDTSGGGVVGKDYKGGIQYLCWQNEVGR